MRALEDRISKKRRLFSFVSQSKRSGPRSLLNASASKCDVGHGTCDSGGPISPTPSVTRLLARLTQKLKLVSSISTFLRIILVLLVTYCTRSPLHRWYCQIAQNTTSLRMPTEPLTLPRSPRAACELRFVFNGRRDSSSPSCSTFYVTTRIRQRQLLCSFTPHDLSKVSHLASPMLYRRK